jgi:hypothetical protein
LGVSIRLSDVFVVYSKLRKGRRAGKGKRRRRWMRVELGDEKVLVGYACLLKIAKRRPVAVDG